MRSTIEGVDVPRADDPILSYLHHVGIVQAGPVHAEDIFERLEDEVTSPKEALRFLEALATYATDYAAIATPSHPKWTSYDMRVKAYVSSISEKIKMVFARPLMLAVAAHFDRTETNRAFRNMVAWVVRFLIAGGSRSGGTEQAIGRAAQAIKAGKIKSADALADELAPVVPGDTRFHDAFKRKTITSERIARFILLELEDQRRMEGKATLEQPSDGANRLSVETCLAQESAGQRLGALHRRRATRL